MKPLKDKADKFEREMTRLHREIAKLDGELAKPDLFARDAGKAADIAKRRADAARDLETAENAWLAAHEEYEKAMAE